MDNESLVRASYMAGQTLVYALLMLIAVFVVRKLISNHYKKKQQQKEEFNRANSRAYDGPAEKLEIQPPDPPAEHLEIQEPAREEDDAPPPEDGR
ncbi:hypothetical protein LJB68_13190 [bacterium 210820-DFI.6.52]|nr:hypothetical protein [bacterium 210820-DFI.6.52]